MGFLYKHITALHFPESMVVVVVVVVVVVCCIEFFLVENFLSYWLYSALL
jgi:hypothetical protein